MRVSDSMRLDAMVRQQGGLQEKYLDASRVASTGQRIGQPSDDPVGASQNVRIQGSLDSLAQYHSAIGSAQGDLSLSETALASAGDLLARAGELALQGTDGMLSAADRQVLAKEAAQLKEQLVGLANTKGTNGYLFGGTATQTPPFDPAGVFKGNGADRVAEVALGMAAVTSVSGAMAFTATGGRDVVADLNALNAALTANNPAAIAATVANLDASRRQILAARADAGLKGSKLDTVDSANQSAQLSLQTQQHAVLNADPTASYSQLMALQNAIDQSIAVARNTLSTLTVNRFQ